VWNVPRKPWRAIDSRRVGMGQDCERGVLMVMMATEMQTIQKTGNHAVGGDKIALATLLRLPTGFYMSLPKLACAIQP
jgi:hypothetical protein